jgi:hypothetical protein
MKSGYKRMAKARATKPGPMQQTEAQQALQPQLQHWLATPHPAATTSPANLKTQRLRLSSNTSPSHASYAQLTPCSVRRSLHGINIASDCSDSTNTKAVPQPRRDQSQQGIAIASSCCESSTRCSEPTQTDCGVRTTQQTAGAVLHIPTMTPPPQRPHRAAALHRTMKLKTTATAAQPNHGQQWGHAPPYLQEGHPTSFSRPGPSIQLNPLHTPPATRTLSKFSQVPLSLVVASAQPESPCVNPDELQRKYQSAKACVIRARQENCILRGNLLEWKQSYEHVRAALERGNQQVAEGALQAGEGPGQETTWPHRESDWPEECLQAVAMLQQLLREKDAEVGALWQAGEYARVRL